MATVRITGIDVATGLERAITAGDVIENFGGVIAGMIFRGAIANVGEFPADPAREVGDMYTITSVGALVDPGGTGQTVQPGDEIVWDGAAWAIVGNASAPNVQSALMAVLTADEDMLLRISGAIGRLPVGTIGQFLQVTDAGAAVPQVEWATPSNSRPSTVFDLSAAGPGAVPILPTHVNNIVIVGPSANIHVLPDPDALAVGDEITLRHPSVDVVVGGGANVFPIVLDLAVAAVGLLEGIVAGGPGLPWAYAPNSALAATQSGGVTLRVTQPDGGGPKNWMVVDDFQVDHTP